MNCDRVFDLAVGFIEGTLGAEAPAVAAHLDGCEACRGLIASLREAPPEDLELTTLILERTAGPACESARERLCDWTDGMLDSIDAGYVNGHLERCTECTALVGVLASMRTELPGLAELEPDPAFVAAVLARTSRKPRRVPLAERLFASVQHLLDRPRIALEGAFIAAALVVLPFGGPESTLVALRQATGATSASLNMLAHSAWATTRGFVAEHAPGTFSYDAASKQAEDKRR